MPADFQIQFKDHPESFLKSVVQAVKPYEVGLAIEILKPDGHQTDICRFIGSGTLVRWNNKYGILTAEHVTSFPADERLKLDLSWDSPQRLRVALPDRPNTFGFAARVLQVHTLGKSDYQGFGPDLAVIELPPSEELTTLMAKKSFWNLTNRTEEKVEKALDVQGTIAVVGHLGEDLDDKVGPMGGFEEVTCAPGLVVLVAPNNYFERDGFDYIEVVSERNDTNKAPKSYRGVSGGSLWRVPFKSEAADDTTNVIHGNPTLAGVPFYQLPEQDHKIVVRAHGPKSIYQKLLAHLTSNNPQ